MAYKLIHTNWFSNRPLQKRNALGITPSSRFMYKENEMQAYKNSCSMMSQALLYVSNQITKKSAQLLARNNSDSSYTDGKHIVIGMNPMRKYDDVFEGMDVEMGLACHESCHCAFTNFADYSLSSCTYPIAQWIHNLYEDECIEEMLGIRQPQWMYFLDNVRNHYFNEEKFDESVKKLMLTKNKLDIIQFLLLYMVRMPRLAERIPLEWQDKYGVMLDMIYEHVIINIENPSMFRYTPTSDTSIATLDTIEILKKFISLDDMNKDLSNSTLGMIGNSTTEGDPNKSNDKSNRTCGKNGLYDGNTMLGREKSNKSVEERFNKAKKENERDNSKIYTFNNAAKEIGAAIPNQIDVASYNKIKSSITEYINIAKEIIIPNKKAIELEDDKFHRNGQLISSHLVQAIQGVNCVYHRKVIKKSETNDPKYAFVIAIDESGSMSMGVDDSNPANIATKLAITFYEAMKDYPGIELYIYGHGDNIVKYISPKDNIPYKLGNRKSQMTQNESISYKTIIDEVKLKTRNPIFFLNITDSIYLEKNDRIQETIEEYKQKKCQFGLIVIDNKINCRNYNSVISLNNQLYGESNWVTIEGNKDSFKKALKQFATIVRTKYKKL